MSINLYRSPTAIPDLTMDDQALHRFWSKVDKNGPVPTHCPVIGPCWEWTGCRADTGYGLLRLNGRLMGAHRIAYRLATGNSADGVSVLHRCDNPGCVNPAHLIEGTPKDNMRDARDKGRSAFGERNGAYTHPERVPRGDQNGHSKLREFDIPGIRAHASRGTSIQSIADLYGVHYNTIYRVVLGISWKHVEGMSA